MIERNTSGLKAHSETKSAKTEKKVNTAIDRLKQDKRPINFNTIAAEAGVSKATLYNHPRLRERISSLRMMQKQSQQQPVPVENMDAVKLLRAEVRRLKKDKENLILQLLEFEEIKEENRKLRDRLSLQPRQEVIDSRFIQKLRESSFAAISGRAEAEILRRFGGETLGVESTEQDFYEQIRKIISTY